MESPTTGEIANVGHEAHIVAGAKSGPRGNSGLTSAERDDYSNLVLLCRHHHGMIDNPALLEDYSVEKLHAIKDAHEAWVREHLLGPFVEPIAEAADLVYSNLVDQAVIRCRLSSWRDWTAGALQPRPYWPVQVVEDVFAFRDQIRAGIFYGKRPILEAALKRFAFTLAGAALRFVDQAEQVNEDTFRSVQFYRDKVHLKYGDPQEKLEALYEYWRNDCFTRIYEATAAANWLADVVRNEFDPMFFAVEGRFMLDEYFNLEHYTRLREYTPEQRAQYVSDPLVGYANPEKLERAIREIQQLDEQLKRKAAR